MRIRRHLFFYNTVSVLVALVAMLAVNGAATHAIGRYYQRQAEQMVRELNIDAQIPEGGAIFVTGDGKNFEMVAAEPPRRPGPAPSF